MFYEKCALRNFQKFTGKHLRQRLFFNRFACFRPTALLKKRLWQVLSRKFCEISKAPFFTEQLWTTASDDDAIIESSIDSGNLIPLTCLISLDTTITLMHSIVLRTGKYLANNLHSLGQRCKTTVIWKTDTTVYIHL